MGPNPIGLLSYRKWNLGDRQKEDQVKIEEMVIHKIRREASKETTLLTR